MQPLSTTTESNLDKLKPIYFPSECSLDSELFLHIAENTTQLDCMVGYFTSGSLRELARSIACYLSSSSVHKLRFIISPNLIAEDIEALESAINSDRNLMPFLFPDFVLDEETLRSKTVKALSYLVVSGQLELKIAVKKTGLFHSKCWIFETNQGSLAVHGSGNATQSGLAKNFEQITVSRSWMNEDARFICEDLKSRFETLWENKYDGIVCRSPNQKTLEQIRNISLNDNKKEATHSQLLSELLECIQDEEGDAKEIKKLSIPNWLKFDSGPYKHQGEAVRAWMENGKGILSIATGGGKTLTSLVAATLLSSKLGKLMVVVAVPTKALLKQWEADIVQFGILPVNGFGKSSRELKRAFKQQLRNLRLGVTQNEILLVTHEGLKSSIFEGLENTEDDYPILLIGDEVHNLGSAGFQAAAKEKFTYRLGLSATHERQFDEEGTKFLQDYFGEVVYSFPLESAIGVCLVPFEYYVHRVSLEPDEQEEWSELTLSIRKLSYAANLPDGAGEKERWKLLCLKRRRIVESANGKILQCASILPSEKNKIQRTLFFCTDKDPEQLDNLNALLTKRSINFHQVTAEETANERLLNKVVASFHSGELQALTSKRVLDEGFNIPQTETAYFLASNTVRRQWVQRLGRVLRLSPDTGKKTAFIHDFVVVPCEDVDPDDSDLKGLLQGEFDRISFFSKLSLNGLEQGGSIALMSEFLEILGNKK